MIMNKLPKDYTEYKPLLEGLKIQDSRIHGQGLFTIKLIPTSKVLGPTHYEYSETEPLLRLPLGGFVNHSDKPNCRISSSGYGFHVLITERVIQPDEELTINYNVASCAKNCKK